MINTIAIDDEPLALKVIESFCAKTDFITLQKTFTQPGEALKHLRKFPAELLFVDINMPSMSGISLVKALEHQPMIIFTTAFSEYAVASYELNAIDYLLKPINFQRFDKAAKKALDYYNYQQRKDKLTDSYIYIRADFSLVKIPLADILYIEGLADYLRIFIRDRKTIVARMAMKDLLDKLPAEAFMRVHRSFIVPVAAIRSVRNSIIQLPDKEIPIGKTYLEEFRNRFSGS
jgi:DNA-binding LytR/AlgR family response regulator